MKKQLNTYKIWDDEDSDDFILIEAYGMNEALDKAAIHCVYIDYCDMAQERRWNETENEDDGLNIILVSTPIKKVGE